MKKNVEKLILNCKSSLGPNGTHAKDLDSALYDIIEYAPTLSAVLTRTLGRVIVDFSRRDLESIEVINEFEEYDLFAESLSKLLLAVQGMKIETQVL